MAVQSARSLCVFLYYMRPPRTPGRPHDQSIRIGVRQRPSGHARPKAPVKTAVVNAQPRARMPTTRAIVPGLPHQRAICVARVEQRRFEHRKASRGSLSDSYRVRHPLPNVAGASRRVSVVGGGQKIPTVRGDRPPPRAAGIGRAATSRPRARSRAASAARPPATSGM